MALIPGFEYDIFISYAHLDNMALSKKELGWIELFYKNLNLMLAKRFGRMGLIEIWWDTKKLDGNILFDDSIEEGIRKSAIMICLNSPGYLKSEYCQKELELFYNKAKNEREGLKLSNRTRIVNVLLNNIPFKDWPDPLSGSTGFPFYSSLDKDDFGETIESTSSEFRQQMVQLREALFQLISELAKVDVFENVLVEDYNPNIKDFSIYLGEVPDTLRTPRKRIVNELEKKGYKIISGSPPPEDIDELEKKTSEDLKKSSLAVHLLDKYPGREIINANDNWYTKKQVEIALKSGNSQMIWLPLETDFKSIEEDNYKEFLYNLEAGTASYKAYEFVKGSKSDLAQQIIDYANKLNLKKTEGSITKESVPILIDTHFNDQICALDLCKLLLDNNVQPFINPQANDPRLNLDILAQRIQQVKKIVFIYGSISKDWVVERMSAALQIIIENNYAIDSFYVYMLAPVKNPEDVVLNQRYLKISVFDNSHNTQIEETIFNSFVSRLKEIKV